MAKKCEPFEVVLPLGQVGLAVKVDRVGDATGAYCPTCQQMLGLGDLYWGPSQIRWMHQRGTGHKVILVRPAAWAVA